MATGYPGIWSKNGFYNGADGARPCHKACNHCERELKTQLEKLSAIPGEDQESGRKQRVEHGGGAIQRSSHQKGADHDACPNGRNLKTTDGRVGPDCEEREP